MDSKSLELLFELASWDGATFEKREDGAAAVAQ
jgi:hypothetical protein